jgi:hypothetical protein
MANSFVYSDSLIAADYVVTTSRYNSSSVGFYGPQAKITFNIYQRKEITQSVDDRFMQITPGYEYRPDLVSQKAYGMPDYWWLILQANNINDVYQFTTGKTIRIPVDITTTT